MGEPGRWNVDKLLLLAAAALMLVVVATNAILMPAFAPQLVPLLPGIVGAMVLLFWARPWLYLATGILLAAFPLIVIFVFGASGAITNPGGGFEGLTVTMMLFAAIFGLLGGILGFAHTRGGKPGDTRGLASPTALAALVLAGALVGYAAANGWSTQQLQRANENPIAYAESVDEHVRLVASGVAWGPRNVTIPAGKLVSLDIENKDPVFHTFAYHLADGVHEIPLYPHETTSVLLKFDTAQTVHFWCAPHSGGQDDHDPASMQGDLIVS